jgi:superfamily II DNA/RNA helicase
MHRIGRAGRFGKPGIALTIFDRKVDEDYFNEIVKCY